MLNSIKRELKIQERISDVVIGRSDTRVAILANTFMALAKQYFCKHNFAGLDCLNCGKQRGIDKLL